MSSEKKCEITGCDAHAKGRYRGGTLLCARHYKQKQRHGVIINIAPGPRGFHEMDKEKLVRVSRRSGVMSWLTGKAHKWSSEEARAARAKSGVDKRVDKGRIS